MSDLYRPGDSVYSFFSHQAASGQGTPATSLIPTVYRNGAIDLTGTPTFSHMGTGLYRNFYAIPSIFAIGDQLSILAQTTLTGTPSAPTTIWSTRLVGFPVDALPNAVAGTPGGVPRLGSDYLVRAIVEAMAQDSLTATALAASAANEIAAAVNAPSAATIAAAVNAPSAATIAAAVNAPGTAQIIQGLYASVIGDAAGTTFAKLQRLLAAVSGGKSSGLGTPTGTGRFRDIGDSKNVVTATLSEGNRTAMTLDLD